MSDEDSGEDDLFALYDQLQQEQKKKKKAVKDGKEEEFDENELDA